MDWEVFSKGFIYVIPLNGGAPQNGWDADQELKGQDERETGTGDIKVGDCYSEWEIRSTRKNKWMRASVNR